MWTFEPGKLQGSLPREHSAHIATILDIFAAKDDVF